jgi:hypothetical protein
MDNTHPSFSSVSHVSTGTPDSGASSPPGAAQPCGEAEPAPVLRIRSAADICAAVPVLLGFHPERSLVGMAMTASGRVVLTARVDLVDAEECAAALTHALGKAEPDAVAVLAYDEQARDDPSPDPSEQPRAPRAVSAAASRAASRGWVITAGIVVAGDTWWPVGDTQPPACGADAPHPGGNGAQQRQPRHAADSRLLAEAVYRGAVVHRRRADLESLVAPVVPEALDGEASGEVRSQLGSTHADAKLLARARSVLRSLAAPHHGDRATCSHDDAAAVALALRDGAFRDECYGQLVADCRPSGSLLDRWILVLRHVRGTGRAPVAGMVAMAAYLEGNGALANIAVGEALAHAPEQPTAVLVRDLVEHVVPPDSVRDMLRELT